MQSIVASRQSTLHRRSFAASFLPGRFDWLMGLYAENHKRLARLFAPQRLTVGEYVSSVGDGLDVHLSVQERHPYTLELGLSYAVVDESTGHPHRPRNCASTSMQT